MKRGRPESGFMDVVRKDMQVVKLRGKSNRHNDFESGLIEDLAGSKSKHNKEHLA